MKRYSKCPICKEYIEGISWEGGRVVVFEHKGLLNDAQHHYKLSVETDYMDRIHDNEK